MLQVPDSIVDAVFMLLTNVERNICANQEIDPLKCIVYTLTCIIAKKRRNISIRPGITMPP